MAKNIQSDASVVSCSAPSLSAPRTMTVDIPADADAILVTLQLDRTLAECVFADAELRGVRPCDVLANALREHYERINLHP